MYLHLSHSHSPCARHILSNHMKSSCHLPQPSQSATPSSEKWNQTSLSPAQLCVLGSAALWWHLRHTACMYCERSVYLVWSCSCWPLSLIVREEYAQHNRFINQLLGGIVLLHQQDSCLITNDGWEQAIRVGKVANGQLEVSKQCLYLLYYQQVAKRAFSGLQISFDATTAVCTCWKFHSYRISWIGSEPQKQWKLSRKNRYEYGIPAPSKSSITPFAELAPYQLWIRIFLQALKSDTHVWRGQICHKIISFLTKCLAISCYKWKIVCCILLLCKCQPVYIRVNGGGVVCKSLQGTRPMILAWR